MPAPDLLDDVLDAVETRGLFRNARRPPRALGQGSAELEGEVVVEGHVVTLRLVLDAPFPLRLPRFLLRPWDALGVIPHVDRRGVVCFSEPEGLLLDRRRPVDIVSEAFDRAMRVLADGASGRNWAEFADEFEVYWRQLPDGIEVRSVLSPPDDVRHVIVADVPGKPAYIAGCGTDIAAYCNGASAAGNATLRNALYLPLEPGTVLVPPHPDRPFWTAEDARRALLPGLSPANRDRLRRLLSKKKHRRRGRHREYVILKLPRAGAGETIFGIRFEEIGNRHPLLDGGVAEHVAPLRVERVDRNYLVRRGGGDLALLRERVLLVGCGSIGGHLAFALAQAGILDLTLVDPDTLYPENSFRHVLGRRYWYQPKAEGLKQELEAELPYVRATAVAEPIEEALADGAIDLTDYDLIVLATGNPTIELAINERLHQLPSRPRAVVTWLEPFGIGGHALLTGNAADGGCFECLYTPPTEDDEAGLQNRAAFAAPGQTFGTALSGCGSLHTPYGSVDAVRTAALAARLALDGLTGREPGNALVSWRGDARDFTGAGYRLAPRYYSTEHELHSHRYAYRSPRCRVCGAARQ